MEKTAKSLIAKYEFIRARKLQNTDTSVYLAIYTTCRRTRQKTQ